MASPNAPKSSEQLIREHSKARYVTQNPMPWRGDYAEPAMHPCSAVDQLARKYR